MISFLKHPYNRPLVVCGAIVLLCLILMVLLLTVFPRDSAVEVPPGRIHDAGVFGDDIIVHDSSGGEIVIGNARPRDATPMTTANITTDPDGIWTENTHAGRHTLTAQTQMQRGNIGVLTIPDLQLIVNVYESLDNDHIESMEKGVAHFHHTSAWYGNVSLSAHNVNFDGSPGFFLNLHQLQRGAVIRYQTALGIREYVVETIARVNEYDWSMLGWTDDNRITLVTCITGRPDMRLILQAVEAIG